MQLNYYFLKQLSAKVHDQIKGATFIESYSQEKDELIISFLLNNDELFFIRATLTSSFSCLSFPAEFKRSRKNSVNLFSLLEGDIVIKIQQFKNERAFSIHFQSGNQLLFKMFGNRSNIILVSTSGEKILFKNKLPNDKEIQIDELDRFIEPSFESFNLDQNLSTHFPTFGKPVKLWLNNQDYQSKSFVAQWDLLKETESLLNNSTFYLCKNKQKPIFSLLEGADCEKLSNDPIVAVNSFYQYFSKTYYFESRKTTTLNALLKKKRQTENYISNSEQKLASLSKGPQPKEIGDIIMANLHNIHVGEIETTLFNFYTNTDDKIRLNKNISPQKNAENYYRKGKNRKIEIASITKSIESKQSVLEVTNSLISQIETCDSGKLLNSIIKENSLEKASNKELIIVPYKEFVIDGFRIWVGKNAKSNDELTLKYSYKEDLWLHVKDVPGSHLLIKYESNRNFTPQIIEKSAEIAAYYSKRKTDSLAPVIYTPAKFVRKRKGSLPGQVVVEKEKVILVRPKKPS